MVKLREFVTTKGFLKSLRFSSLPINWIDLK